MLSEENARDIGGATASIQIHGKQRTRRPSPSANGGNLRIAATLEQKEAGRKLISCNSEHAMEDALGASPNVSRIGLGGTWTEVPAVRGGRAHTGRQRSLTPESYVSVSPVTSTAIGRVHMRMRALGRDGKVVPRLLLHSR